MSDDASSDEAFIAKTRDNKEKRVRASYSELECRYSKEVGQFFSNIKRQKENEDGERVQRQGNCCYQPTTIYEEEEEDNEALFLRSRL